MENERLGRRGRLGAVRTRAAVAVGTAAAGLFVTGALAAPASAVSGPPTHVDRGRTVERSKPSPRAGAPAELDLVMVALVVGNLGVVVVPVTGRSRIGREHTVRRFRAQLRDPDLDLSGSIDAGTCTLRSTEAPSLPSMPDPG